jgi:hypothetical protein
LGLDRIFRSLFPERLLVGLFSATDLGKPID